MPLYFAAVRPVVRRGDQWIMVDDERLPLALNEEPELRRVRFRTLGCYPLSAAIESNASTVEIVQEIFTARSSERQGAFDRSRWRRLNGAKEAGRLFLMQDALRFVTCGSVDDGKSTLIGRLLFESKQIFDDHLAAIEKDSRHYGTQGEAIDFALLLDGL